MDALCLNISADRRAIRQKGPRRDALAVRPPLCHGAISLCCAGAAAVQACRRRQRSTAPLLQVRDKMQRPPTHAEPAAEASGLQRLQARTYTHRHQIAGRSTVQG